MWIFEYTCTIQNIQCAMTEIKFVSDLWQVGGFLRVLRSLRNGDYIHLLTIFSFHYKYCKRSNHIKQYKIKTRPYMIFVCFMVFNATFNNISVISWWSVLFGRGNRSTRRKPPTCHKSLTNFISVIAHCIFCIFLHMKEKPGSHFEVTFCYFCW
jgi:hypothetical protein